MKHRVATLTPRQREVARLLSLGCSIQQAADILGLSESTVDNHKSAILAKLGTDKTVLLVRLAIANGLSTINDKLTATEKRRSGRKGDGWN